MRLIRVGFCFDGIHWKYSVCLAVNQDKLELLN